MPRLTQPLLILEPDGIFGRCDDAQSLAPHGQLVKLPGKRGLGLFQLPPQAVSDIVRQFLG